MSKTRVGFALTGSFCTFRRAFYIIDSLVRDGYDVTPILSYSSAREDTDSMPKTMYRKRWRN